MLETNSTKSKIRPNTLQDNYCRRMKDDHSIFNEESLICRLFSEHKGEHVWSFLYDRIAKGEK